MKNYYRSDINTVYEIVNGLTHSRLKEDIEDVLRLIDDVVKIDSVIFTGSAFHKGTMKTVSVTNRYPQDWLNHYTKSGYVAIDPVAQVAMVKPGEVFFWSEAFRLRNPPPVFLKESRLHGLTEGIAVGMQTGNYYSLLSIAMEKQTRWNCEKITAVAKTIIPHLHSAMMRIEFNPLTQRELDTLKLIAEGHTNSEVGPLLDPPVTRETVLQCNKRIKSKLDAKNISHAVFVAKNLELF